MRRDRQATKAAKSGTHPSIRGSIKRIWLLLYTEGGWWQIGEVRDRLRIAGYIKQTMKEMSENNFLVRRTHTNIDCETSVQYAVKRGCGIPRGVTIDEMWEVLQAPEKTEAA